MTRHRYGFFFLAATSLCTVPFDLRPLGEGAVRLGFYLLSAALLCALGDLHYRRLMPGAGVPRDGTGRVGALSFLVVLATTGGLCVGLFRHNVLSYVLGDLLRGLIFAVALRFGSRLAGTSGYRDALIVIWKCMVLAESLRFGVFLVVAAGGSFERFGSGSVIPPAFAVAYLTNRMPREPGRERAFVYRIGPWIALANMATSLERSLWLGVAVALVVLVGTRFHPRTVRRVLVAVAPIVLIGLVVCSQTDTMAERAIRARIELTRRWNASSDESYVSRASEVSSSMKAVSEVPFGQMLGGGLGFNYYDPSQGTRVHQIHNTYVSIYVRHGVIGGGAMAATIALGLHAALKRRTASAFLGVEAAVIATVVSATFFYSILGDPIAGILYGAVLSRAKAVATRRHEPEVLPALAIAGRRAS